MSKCYKCHIELVNKEVASPEVLRQKRYRSEEHILPNFIGGQLTSNDLLCSRCNSDLGKLEGELSNQLLFHQLFSIKLDRGKQSDSFVMAYTTDSKKKVLVNRNLGWKHFKPEYTISENGELIDFTCQTKSEAKKILTGLSKKYPKINVDDCLKRLVEVEDYLPEKIDFNHVQIGGKETHMAIAKIAVNYYLYQQGDIELLKDVIDYICLPDKANNYVTFYYSFMPIHKFENNEISHIIFLKADNRRKLLYCYIELFSVANFLVMLNRDYEGENYTKQYCYDIIKGKELKDKEIKFGLFFDPFESLKLKSFNDKEFEDTEEYIKDRVTRAFEVLENINPKVV